MVFFDKWPCHMEDGHWGLGPRWCSTSQTLEDAFFFQATVASRPGLECWQGWNYVFMGVAWMHWLRKRCKGPQRKYAVSMVFVCFSAPRFVRRYVLLYISVVRLDCKFDDILFVWGFQVYIKVVIFLESQWIAVSCGCVVHADSVRIAYP